MTSATATKEHRPRGKAQTAYPRSAKIERTVAAARAAGIKVGGIEVEPDGTIRILSESSSVGPADAYSRWKAKQAKG